MEKSNFFVDNFNSLIAFLGTVFGGIIGWFTGKKRSNAETDAIEIGNFAKGFETYQQLLDDLKNRLIAVEKSNSDLAKELHKCKKDMQQVLEEKIKSLKNS